ncbi:MAG: hypothetical protein A2W91_03035 [Bacteroidetes bacterium GWF2_38_335]|nr:MAG: hypothetical protein A2W91_03035 [Bacteroidetes bacterium GWF2_38_335]OFY77535.1 MAG: hypothetical protein A2281_01725 [Bacteroidetes bacterium RIFOXYA12_FULL_38_20]HBS87168.1 hypothetical protein [Bacteroidales bacterium]
MIIFILNSAIHLKAIFFLPVLISYYLHAQYVSGEEVIKSMYDQYKNQWYQNVSFEQYAYFYENDSVTKTEIWQEAYVATGMLGIRFNGFDSKNGMLFRNDSVYIFADGNLKNSGQKIHDLLLLGFDVYNQFPEVTVEKLKQSGFDLTKVYEIKTDSMDIIVVGAEPGDLNTNQFWIEKKRMLFLRMIKNSQKGKQEVFFNDYEKLDGGWIEKEVLFYLDDKLYMKEKYFNISTKTVLNSNLFIHTNFIKSKW